MLKYMVSPRLRRHPFLLAPQLHRWMTALLLALFSTTVNAADAGVVRQQLVLAGPPSVVSYPLLHMIESGALADIAKETRFVSWTNPDQLRALALEGKTDFVAMPTNVAANLYNRGVALRLMDVSVWGMLWVVTRDPNLKTIADLKDQEVAVPFRADMPDIVFSFLATRAGLNPRKDLTVGYLASPIDAMQWLVTRRVDHALLAEPAVSMALRKTHSFPLSIVAPELYRGLDLQAEWGRLMHTPSRLPQAGMVVMGPAVHDKALAHRLEAAYAASYKWCIEHAQSCGALAAKHMDMLTPQAATDAIQALPTYYASADQARPELEAFLQLLLERQPAAVGGKLPDDGFYAQDKP